MDGVLVDSSEAHFQAWHQLGEREGRPFTREMFCQTFGMHNQQILPMWTGTELESLEMERLADWKEATYRELAPRLMRPIPGVVALIRALQAEGVPLAVGSSGPLPNIRLILESLSLQDCFSALATGEDVRHGKPDPEVFLVAARRLNLEPARCVVVEDAPQGVEAARRAGMAVLAITSSRPARDLAADQVVESFESLGPRDLKSLLGAG
jgi:HAD superfamily hydrolase (TIGR01509 family)